MIRVKQILDFFRVISPASIGADQNDYNPTSLNTARRLRLTSSVAVNITGLVAPTIVTDKNLFITNVGNFAITLVSESASSTAANRFGFVYDCVIGPNETVELVYSSTGSRWRLVGNRKRIIFSQTSSVTVGNSAAEATILSSATGNKTIPANTLSAGSNIKILLYGVCSRRAPRTINIRVKIGGTTVLTTGAVNPGTSTNIACKIEAEIDVRSLGAGGAMIGQGQYTTFGQTALPMSNTATSAIDTTVANAIDVTAQWSAAAADSTITITNGTIEVT